MTRAVGNKCKALNCSSVRGLSSGISFHHFPKDEATCKAWINLCGNAAQLNQLPIDSLHKTSNFLCSLHFETSQFKSTAPRNILKQNVVPTKFFHNTGEESDEQSNLLTSSLLCLDNQAMGDHDYTVKDEGLLEHNYCKYYSHCQNLISELLSKQKNNVSKNTVFTSDDIPFAEDLVVSEDVCMEMIRGAPADL